jgi:hypothetical protein
MGKRRKFTNEFKLEAVKLTERGVWGQQAHQVLPAIQEPGQHHPEETKGWGELPSLPPTTGGSAQLNSQLTLGRQQTPHHLRLRQQHHPAKPERVAG